MEIQLTKGYAAIIDDDDYDKVKKYKWHVGVIKKNVYAQHCYRDGKTVRKLPMQYVILGKAPKGMIIDHVNGNGLDNRKDNLRFVTHRQNTSNLHMNKKSPHPGVSWNSKENRWVVKPLINGKIKRLGTFSSEIDAAKRYREFLEKERVVICS